MKILNILLTTACLLALSACSSPEERANKLLVEAIQLIQAAEGEPSAQKKRKLLRQARDSLQTIVDDYPSTDLAVKLITKVLYKKRFAGERQQSDRGGGISGLFGVSDVRMRHVVGPCHGPVN